MIGKVLTLSALVSIALCMTTQNPHHHGHHHTGTHAPHQHHTGPTMEPHESEHFNFKYDPVSDKMAVTVDKDCYIYDMNVQEMEDVHDPSKFRMLEGTLIQEITKQHTDMMTPSTMSHDDLMAASASLAHGCNHNIYVLTHP